MVFEKVKFDTWGECVDSPLFEDYNDIKLPKQGTTYSMGMDFYAPYDITIYPKSACVIPTGIKWKPTMKERNYYGLLIVPRSGLGFQYGLRLANTIGVIDADYQDAHNEGHIIIKMYNPSEHTLVIPKGKAFAQGIVMPYKICDGAFANNEREGGFGSTDN